MAHAHWQRLMLVWENVGGLLIFYASIAFGVWKPRGVATLTNSSKENLLFCIKFICIYCGASQIVWSL